MNKEPVHSFFKDMYDPAAEATGDRKVHMDRKDMASVPYGVIMPMWVLSVCNVSENVLSASDKQQKEKKKS
jgi:hypothetical protein